MDLPVQVKSVELLVKLVKHDVANIPAYGYTQQKPPMPRALRPRPLPRATPEECGISSAAVERLFKAVQEDPRQRAHDLLLIRHNKVIAEGAFAPYRIDTPHMLYSMSKSITATAVGFALDEGLLALDEKLVDIFSDSLGALVASSLKSATLRHLLTMSTGSRFNEVGSMLDDNWVRMFMETTPKFEPGTEFEYNSLNTYMLAAAVTRRAGMSVCQYLKPRLFDPLHIEEYSWETCPRGVEKGGWGLSLKAEDAAKIGLLYLNKGVWEGKRLLSEDWVREATKLQIETPRAESTDGYGYQIWMNGRDSYLFNGAFGQYVIVYPEFDAVAVMFSGCANLFKQGSVDTYIRACLFGASEEPLPENPPAFARLKRTLGELKYASGFPNEGLGTDPREFLHITELLGGKEFRLRDNIGGVFPQGLQAVHGNFTPGADLLRFENDGGDLTITVYEDCERNTVVVPRDGSFSEHTVGMRGERQRVSVRGEWRLTASGIQLAVYITFIETPNTRVIFIELKNALLSVRFFEYPTIEDSTEMLLDLVGYSKTAFFKRLVPAIQRIPAFSGDTLAQTLSRFTTPTSEGRLIVKN